MEQLNREQEQSKKSKMPTGDQQDVEAQLIEIVEGINAAFREKDIEKIMSYYAKDVVAFDMMPPLEFNGVDSYRKAWQIGMDGMSETGPFEDAHRHFHISGDLAVMHSLCHMTGTLKKNNQKIDSWARYTGVFENRGGKWLITHEQFSVPIDMESEKAMWNLKPEKGMMQ